jgi:hypothetical protein
MANEAKAGNGKRTKIAVKSDWVVNGKVKTRTVKTKIGSAKLNTQKDIEYVETALVGVADLATAADLLKLRGMKAIKALTLGVNALARKQASGDSTLVQKLAERKGISLDEARKIIG